MKHKKIATCISLYEDVFTADSSALFLKTLEEEIMDEWKDEYIKDQTGKGARIKKIREQFTGNSTSEQIKNYFLGE